MVETIVLTTGVASKIIKPSCMTKIGEKVSTPWIRVPAARVGLA